MSRRFGSDLAVLCTLCFVALNTAGFAEPVVIKIGHSSAVTGEEPLRLIMAKPEMFSNYKKHYTLEPALFPAGDKRFMALEAGAIDIASLTANFVISAAAEGVALKSIASMSKETVSGFATYFAVLENSPIKSTRDLRGKTIGVNGLQGSGQLWAGAVLEKEKIPESEVTFANIRFPLMSESLRAGRIDVAMFPQPFAAMVESEGGIRKLFTSKDAAPFDEELMLITSKPEYLRKNEAAVRAFLVDLKDATKFYNENTKAARQIFLDKKFVSLAPDVYFKLTDYDRDPSLKINIDSLEKMQDLQFKVGFQKQRANIRAIVDNGYLTP